MKQVKVLKNGDRVYVEAPVRRETREEYAMRILTYAQDSEYVRTNLVPGKPKFTQEVSSQ